MRFFRNSLAKGFSLQKYEEIGNFTFVSQFSKLQSVLCLLVKRHSVIVALPDLHLQDADSTKWEA